jgi:hypothetical protein
LAGIAATQAKRALACRHPLSAVEGGGRLDPVPTEPVGAEKVVRLCDLRICVLVDQTAKPLTPVDNEVIGRRRRRGSPGGRCLAEGTVRPVGVVVVDVDREDEVELAAVDDQDPVEELPAEAADPSLGDRVRSGRAGTGVRTIWMPSALNTASNGAVNLLSRSRIRYLNRPARSPRSISRSRAH